jgi:CRISPR-associated protein Cas5t
MKAVKIKLYQNMVNYRREMSFGYVQTYPLPTPSMVKGMVHAILELKKYHNLKISVQGDYDTIVTNMQTMIKFDSIRDEPKKGYIDSRDRIDVQSAKGKANATINKGPQYVDQIVNINLMLHIQFDEEELNYKLLKAVQEKLIILGRNEDIARVDEVKLVDYSDYSDYEDYQIKNNIYIEKDFAKENELSGTHYRLPFYYRSVKSFKDKRIFKFVDAVYVTSGELEDDVLVDEDKDLISFLSVNI